MTTHVTILRARSIDQLSAAVSDYDLVLTTDAPLSLALNRRLDTPHLGRFAATPRMLAAGEYRPHDERPLFQELVTRTDLSWKQTSYLIENILGCWEETGDLEAILNYDAFDNAATRTAISIISETDSAHSDLARTSIDPATDVAVIDEAQFSILDKQLLPDDYDTIDPFETGSFDLPTFHTFESKTAIVQTLLANVSPATADDVAVIMDRGSDYPTLVEAAFAANDIPFYGGPGFAESDDLRTAIGLLRVALNTAGTRIGDVRPLVTRLGLSVPSTHDEKRLLAVDDPALADLQQFCATVEDSTFDTALATIESMTGTSLTDLRTELEALGIADSPVTEARLDDLGYYLADVEVPVDRDDSGVLLADASSSVYVDRPVVFYLGMDAGWTNQIPDRPWIDAAAKDQQYLRQFQILLQNGRQQYYLVQESSAGRPVTPCLYFHDLLETDFETFSDLDHTVQTSPWRDRETGFDHDPVQAEPATIQTLSQSSLSTFVNSPRDYFFDQLVDTPDKDYFRKGTLYHDFAEFYVNYPEVIADTADETLVDLMVTEMRPFTDDIDRPILRTEFATAIDLIRAFIDEQPPQERSYDAYETLFPDNFFADYFDREIDSPITEQWFEDPDLGGKGVVDLIHSPTRLLDYKSGSQSSATSIVGDSDIEDISDTPDFQALLYLAHHRRVVPDEDLTFVFFHFLDILDDAIAGTPDLEEAMVRISYYPESVAEFVTRRETFDELCTGVAESNDRRKTLEGMGYEAYADFFDAHPFPTVAEKDALLETEVAEAFTARAKDLVGDYVYVENGTESALKQLFGLTESNYFREDVDAFERFLDEQIDLINEYRRSAFPVGDPNPDRLSHRDLIREAATTEGSE